MADEKKDKKASKMAAKVQKEASRRASGKSSLKSRLFLAMSVIISIVFLPTSMLVFVGMLPSVMAFVVSSRASGARVSTIFAMNLAGCIPFIFKLWSSGNDFEASFDIITNMRYMTIIYLAAAFGYMIDWVVTGIVSSFLFQRGMGRMEAIKRRQENLVKQWGKEVSTRPPHKVDHEFFDE